MLAYAANRPVAGKRPSSPSAMLLIISAHVALIAAVMSAKMEFQERSRDPRTIVTFPIDPPPPPPNPTANPSRHPLARLPISDPNRDVPLPPADAVPLDTGSMADPGATIGGGTSSIPNFPTQLVLPPVHREARLLTRPDELKPPYPESKILSEEEAALTLRLTIDERGRVIE